MNTATDHFTAKYGSLVAHTWSDESYLKELLDHPADEVNKAGLTTKDNAVVRVIQVKETGFGSIESQINDWKEGDKTGVYTLWLPLKPADLSDDNKISGVAAGSTTCTPCCTCT